MPRLRQGVDRAGADQGYELLGPALARRLGPPPIGFGWGWRRDRAVAQVGIVAIRFVSLPSEQPAHPAARLGGQETGEQGQRDGSVVLDQEAARLHRRNTQQRERGDCRQQPIRQIETPFARRRLLRMIGRAGQFLETIPEVAERPPSQIGQVEVIAQHVVPIELEQGAQVQERLDPGAGHDDQRHVVDHGIRFGQAPRQYG